MHRIANLGKSGNDKIYLPKYTLKGNLTESLLFIASFLGDDTFWNNVQSTAALSRFVQNLRKTRGLKMDVTSRREFVRFQLKTDFGWIFIVADPFFWGGWVGGGGGGWGVVGVCGVCVCVCVGGGGGVINMD